MAPRGINIRLSAESIQDIDDVKTWARGIDVNVEQLRDAITQLVDTDDKQQAAITRNLKLLRNYTIVLGSAFAIVIALFGIALIAERVF